MYYKHRYNLIRFDLSTTGTAYKLFIKSLYDYVIVKEVTVSDVTVRSYFIAAKDLEANWTDRASLTYSTDIKGRKLLNEGQDWLLAAIGRITELKAGVNYKVEDYPLNWIDGTYYSTYKDNTFQVPSIENVKSDYAAVNRIFLYSQNLTTDFTNTLLGKFSNLNRLDCYNNQITTLDVSQSTLLTILNCHNNQISVLEVSQLVNLQYLFCDDNQITTLDVSQLVNLIILRCFNNQISVLDVSQLTSLTTINCINNQISILDVSQLVNLIMLRCSYNQISVLNVSQLVNLIELSCTNNQISTLDVSQLVNLNNLQCHNNQLDAATNSQILIDLDNNGLSNGYFISTIFGGGSLTTAGQTAKSNLQAKGWTIVGI